MHTLYYLYNVITHHLPLYYAHQHISKVFMWLLKLVRYLLIHNEHGVI